MKVSYAVVSASFLSIYYITKKEHDNLTLKTFFQRQEEFNCAVVKFIAFNGIQ